MIDLPSLDVTDLPSLDVTDLPSLDVTDLPSLDVTGPQGVAAFEFDGTLIPGDSFLPFLVSVVGRRRFAQILAVSGPAMARAYRVGRRDGSKVEIVKRCLQGFPADRLGELGETYGEQLAGGIPPMMAERVAWHAEQGHRLVIVSASLEVYLAPLGRILGFGARSWPPGWKSAVTAA